MQGFNGNKVSVSEVSPGLMTEATTDHPPTNDKEWLRSLLVGRSQAQLFNGGSRFYVTTVRVASLI